MKYKLVSDDSGHDYVIPSDKSDDWYDFDFEDDNFRLPPWAVIVSGGLEFENPTEDGEELFPRKIVSIDFSTCKNWDECMKFMENQPDYKENYNNWIQYWKDSGLIKEKQFI